MHSQDTLRASASIYIVNVWLKFVARLQIIEDFLKEKTVFIGAYCAVLVGRRSYSASRFVAAPRDVAS